MPIAFRKAVVAALLVLACAPGARAEATAAVAVEQEAYACVQLVLPRGDDAQLDLAKLQQPRYRLGARLSGQSCADAPLVDVAAEHVAPLLQTLRALGRQSAEPGALRDAVARCGPAGPGVGLGNTPPVFAPGQLTLHLDACGSPLVATAALPTDPAADRVLDVSVAPGAAAVVAAAPTQAPPAPEPGWRPDSGRIDATAKRDKDGDENDDEIKLRVDTTWARGPNETRLELEADYERDGGEAWDREATGRLGRIRQFTPGWFSMYEGFLERNQVRVQSTDEDYVLLQASAGGGYRWQWDETASLRAAFLWNYFYFDLLDLDRSANLDAPSLFLSGHWAITSRLNALATVRVYHWPDGDTGTEIDSDIGYDLTKHLGFGLRWRYTRDGASLDRDDEDKTEMFLRYRF
ncbi:MAG: DUF481 domain-containing protein [Arenimonas sp.]|nr:DUF481 domain-containing protein [Arenimonas sp.]